MSYSLLVALAVAGAVHGGAAARGAVVGAVGLLAAAAVNARSRFRHCTLPWLVVPAATYLWRPDVPATAALLTTVAVLVVVRRAAGPRRERHGGGGVTEATRRDGTVPIHFPHV